MSTQRVVLVTGGNKGIGKAISTAFAANGDAVIINFNKSRDIAKTVREELLPGNTTISLEQADISDYRQVKQMINNIMEKYGKIDIVVNNAGIVRDGF